MNNGITELNDSEIDQIGGGSVLFLVTGAFVQAGAIASTFYADLPTGSALL